MAEWDIRTVIQRAADHYAQVVGAELDRPITGPLAKLRARATCAHPRAAKVFHADGRRECSGCSDPLPPERPTPIPTPWDGGDA